MDKVPQEKICEVVMSYIIDDGKTRIMITKNSDGTWKVEPED
jgi:hypothetical protein